VPQVRLAVCARMVGLTLVAALIPTAPALANTSPTGGSGLGSPPTTKANAKKKATKAKKKTTVKAEADPTTVLNSNPILAPVKQDGGSQHLGERTLRQGMHGHDVRVLQGYLTMDGFETNVDGDFGPTTKNDVIQFENANALKANGVMTYAQSLVLRQAVAKAMTSTTSSTTSTNTVAGSKATINPDGTASAPSGAPPVVQKVIAAANQIIDTSYCYAGGHGNWKSSCYDCSGSVSYALHGGGLLNSPEDSTGLESYGDPGKGKWITIYADASHTWIIVAGLAFDTAHWGPTTPAGTGPRWLTPANATANLQDGGDYVIRHPAGL
jgi:peptidoglycan hydrolase-like protein with peptidoglycan-binding domain